MKKIIALILSLCLVLGMLAGCTDTKPEAEDEKITLTVFAAASMKETLTEIGDLYKAVDSNVELVFSFASSGTLMDQIVEGAECDVFISASPKQMNQLDSSRNAEGGNTDGLDYVLQGTRIDLLENKVTLSVPDDNPANIKSFDDLINGLKAGTVKLAMGNSDVPVGQYTQKILTYYEMSEEELVSSGCITYGADVKEVTTQVKEATVDCGIIYATDAFSAELTVVDTATTEMCGQVIYPAAVLNITKNEAAAKAFLEYLKGDEASAVFESVGFSPLS